MSAFPKRKYSSSEPAFRPSVRLFLRRPHRVNSQDHHPAVSVEADDLLIFDQAIQQLRFDVVIIPLVAQYSYKHLFLQVPGEPKAPLSASKVFTNIFCNKRQNVSIEPTVQLSITKCRGMPVWRFKLVGLLFVVKVSEPP